MSTPSIPEGHYHAEYVGGDYRTGVVCDIGAIHSVLVATVNHDDAADRYETEEISPQQAEALAKLFAAAPLMLEALEAIWKFGSHSSTEDGTSTSYLVERAIAAAT